eukprot:scaffold10054_cov140-Cylindrotheca_fusiformis.AAC.11
MSICYEAPHVMICCQDENGLFPNDGFHVVCHGIVVLDQIELKVFELENFCSNSDEPSEPVLSIQLPHISFVHFAKFRSYHGNHHGGQIKIIGTFDRLQRDGSSSSSSILNEKKQMTIQMRLDDFAPFKAQLKSQVG